MTGIQHRLPPGWPADGWSVQTGPGSGADWPGRRHPRGGPAATPTRVGEITESLGGSGLRPAVVSESPDFQAHLAGIGIEVNDVRGVCAKHFLYRSSRLVPAVKPYKFRRRTLKRQYIEKIGIQRDEDESVGLCIFPDGYVLRTLHA